MKIDKLRRRIACEAARLIFSREELGFSQAKMKAARLMLRGDVRPGDLPDNREIREHLQILARIHESVSRTGWDSNVEELEDMLKRRFPNIPLASREQQLEAEIDRFSVYETLLLPLEQVRENPETHPEGDALYHSLQVFDLARNELPYDEEFLLAALLHDVGKWIDRKDHIAAGLEALAGVITPRTVWLIEHHVEALDLLDGTLGVRSRRRLEVSESYHELMLLARCDREGCSRGRPTPDLDEALTYIRDLAQACDE